ncbi:hypothetical protein ACFWJ4_29445 [Kitasatospora sp. NPDC127067]|uniref:hypothetical protein n=1 Tax=Kitasatospora sp. NPDC127067 TaxID=3347126 RepID=UPI00364F8511
MAYLNYEILTDPAPLQVSEAGEESRGAVYLVVSNPTTDDALWFSTEVRVPFGEKDGDLTPDPKAVAVRIAQNSATDPADEPTVSWDPTTGLLRVAARDPGRSVFKGSGSLVLVLEGFPVSAKAGLVLLRVAERAANGPWVKTNPVTLSLLKREPKVPRNFRPRASLVAAGKDVVLQWSGPDDLTYQIQGPDGPPEPVPPRTGTAAGWQWSPKPGQEPKRDATYTLIATSPSRQQPGYILTTTVHLRSPEFEGVTATDGVHTPWVEGTTDRGRVVLTAQGAQVRNDSNAPGTVSAATADVDTVTATWVRGRDGSAGWIQFPSDGIKVGHGAGNDLGTVTAEKISVNGINTTWVGDRDSGKGWIDFPQSGVNVRKDGQQEWGTVAADKADLNGVNTKWVQGRSASDGWIEFPPAGLNVYQGAGSNQWGTVAADKADLNDLVTQRAQVKERLTLHGGLTVDNVLETLDGPPRLVVHGESEFEKKVNANGHLSVRNGGAWVLHTDDGRISINGGLRVGGESMFVGKVNANGHLSVRTGDAWILHTADDKVAINGNLRVHGAFRADS